MRSNYRISHSMFANSGWLFADMFLALMMVFIVAFTVGKYTPPTQAAPPTPTPHIKGIEIPPKVLTLQIDATGLLYNDPSAIQDVKNQVQHALHRYSSRKAALVQTFGGGPDQEQDTTIAQNVNAILRTLGSQHFIFAGAGFDNFIDLGTNFGTINIRIYFYIFDK